MESIAEYKERVKAAAHASNNFLEVERREVSLREIKRHRKVNREVNHVRAENSRV